MMTCCCDILSKADFSPKNVWFDGDVEGKGHLRWRRALIPANSAAFLVFLFVCYAVVIPVLIFNGKSSQWSDDEARFDLTNLSLAFMLGWAALKTVGTVLYYKQRVVDFETWNTDESPVPIMFRVMWALYVIGTTLTVTNAFVYIVHVVPGPLKSRPADVFMWRAFAQAAIVVFGIFVTREPYIGMQIVWPMGVMFFYDVVASIVADASYPKSHLWIGFGLCIIVYGCLLRLEYATQIKIKGYAFFHISERTAEDIRQMNEQAQTQAEAPPTDVSEPDEVAPEPSV